MYHVIEFKRDWWAELQQAPDGPVDHVLLRRGGRRRAELRPRIIEGGRGPVEAADLLFEDGSVARDVPYAFLTFVDEPAARPTE